jgi:hypothetical protein
MRVKLHSHWSGPDWHHEAGTTVDLPDETATRLVRSRQAEAVDPMPEEESVTLRFDAPESPLSGPKRRGRPRKVDQAPEVAPDPASPEVSPEAEPETPEEPEPIRLRIERPEGNPDADTWNDPAA